MAHLCSENDQGPVAFNIIGKLREIRRQHLVWFPTYVLIIAHVLHVRNVLIMINVLIMPLQTPHPF